MPLVFWFLGRTTAQKAQCFEESCLLALGDLDNKLVLLWSHVADGKRVEVGDRQGDAPAIQRRSENRLPSCLPRCYRTFDVEEVARYLYLRGRYCAGIWRKV